jgi:hypothetical protein
MSHIRNFLRSPTMSHHTLQVPMPTTSDEYPHSQQSFTPDINLNTNENMTISKFPFH